jgi:hypothetical protein
MRLLIVGALAAVGSTGCVTTAFDSAQSPRQGWVYVVGSSSSDPMLWLCPERGDAECELVEVTEVGE